MSSTRPGSSSASDAMIRSYSSTVIRWSGNVPEERGDEIFGRLGAIVAMGLLRCLVDPPLTLAAVIAIVFDRAGNRKPVSNRHRTGLAGSFAGPIAANPRDLPDRMAIVRAARISRPGRCRGSDAGRGRRRQHVGSRLEHRAGPGPGAGRRFGQIGEGPGHAPQVGPTRAGRRRDLGRMPGQRGESLSGQGRADRAGVPLLVPEPEVPLQARPGPVPDLGRSAFGRARGRAAGVGRLVAGGPDQEGRAEGRQGAGEAGEDRARRAGR